MSDENVYIGFWTDRSKGGWSGSYLTVDHESGFYLISFLTLFVRLVGTHLWTMVTFALHQLRSTTEARDGLHHQHQFLLRNSQSSTVTIWDLAKVAWFWRDKTAGSFGRTFPLVSLAIAHLTLFTAAAFFSSKIASGANIALVAASPGCGYLPFINDPSDLTETKTNLQWQIAGRDASDWALDYVRECYDTNSTSSLCETFVRPRIHVNSSIAACPFDSTMCTDEAIQVDTGYLNSATHFGINSDSEDSIDYRRITTCAPIVTDKYTRVNSTEGATVEGDTEYYLNYGRDISRGVNSTFVYSNYFDIRPKNKAYMLHWQYAEAGDRRNSWFIPIDELNKTNGDLTLIRLFNFARYTEPVTDAFYNATELYETDVYDGSQRYKAYFPYVTVMGCVTQHQLCTGRPRVCSDPSGILPVRTSVVKDLRQRAIAQHMWRAMHETTLTFLLSNLGTDALQAQSGLIGEQRLEHIGLPDNQWQTEVKGWVQHAVVNMQRLLQIYVSGYDSSVDLTTLVRPNETLGALFDVCAAQKIRVANTYSFSVFGLFFTLAMGLVIVLTNLSLTSCVGYVQKRTRKGLNAREAWKLGNALQVQRMAYENMGLGKWNSLHALVPTTSKGEKFKQPTRQLRDSAFGSEIGLVTMSPRWFGPADGPTYTPLTPSPYDGGLKGASMFGTPGLYSQEGDYFSGAERKVL